VVAAFVAGIIISFLELACTGQVYAPIIYSIQQGRADAVAWLLAYNLAFILPLIVIFALAFSGMSNKALIDFQTRHTFSVKVALGFVFLALAAVILFGSRMF
jgi:cytochrome c biogenesis protein CcdA